MAKKSDVKDKGGRPKSIDENDQKILDQVKIFGRLVATHEEMAAWFNVTVRTIENYMKSNKDEENNSRFFRVYKKAESETKASLRRNQLKYAAKGNPALLIWMGKQLLGQKDKIDHNHEGQVEIVRIIDDIPKDAK